MWKVGKSRDPPRSCERHWRQQRCCSLGRGFAAFARLNAEGVKWSHFGWPPWKADYADDRRGLTWWHLPAVFAGSEPRGWRGLLRAHLCCSLGLGLRVQHGQDVELAGGLSLPSWTRKLKINLTSGIKLSLSSPIIPTLSPFFNENGQLPNSASFRGAVVLDMCPSISLRGRCWWKSSAYSNKENSEALAGGF